MLVFCSAYSLTLKMEEIRSSETSVDSHLSTGRCIPEDEPIDFVEVSADVNCSILKLPPWKTLEVGNFCLKMFDL
jgi:hypothetical protein